MNYEILPITEVHIKSFNAAVSSVASEKKYLALLKAPSIESTREFVLGNLKKNSPHYVAIHDDKVIGWCDITSLNRDAFSHVGKLGMGVLAEYRGQGIGTHLIKTVLKKAKSNGLTRVELTVRENNTNAMKLYKKVGFEEEGFHRNAVRVDGQYENHISMAILLEDS